MASFHTGKCCHLLRAHAVASAACSLLHFVRQLSCPLAILLTVSTFVLVITWTVADVDFSVKCSDSPVQL